MTQADAKVAGGRRLKAVRLAAGYKTQQEFANLLEVSITTYNNWETGLRRPPNRILAEVKRLTGATADYLLFGDASSLPVGLYQKLVKSLPDHGSESGSDGAPLSVA